MVHRNVNNAADGEHAAYDGTHTRDEVQEGVLRLCYAHL